MCFPSSWLARSAPNSGMHTSPMPCAQSWANRRSRFSSRATSCEPCNKSVRYDLTTELSSNPVPTTTPNCGRDEQPCGFSCPKSRYCRHNRSTCHSRGSIRVTAACNDHIFPSIMRTGSRGWSFRRGNGTAHKAPQTCRGAGRVVPPAWPSRRRQPPADRPPRPKRTIVALARPL